jgi:putative protease
MTTKTSQGRPAPELLAPAGNWDCVHAAVENGADAIYFGLAAGFNARARAVNFSLEDLPRLMAHLHRRGVSGFVTLNTLVFTDELEAFEHHVRYIAESGVDAVLVQDLGAVELIHEVCPQLSVHASTQMTMTCSQTIAAIESLGIDRVVLARECSLNEIRKITSLSSMPVETFVHGALCVAYSGQCLTSESLGGRSANRGQCAQACRLEYELIQDGKRMNLGDMKYLLSPQDLAAYELIPDLIDAGVASLKIEGRLKSPEYVANIVRHYRRAIDDAMAGRQVAFDETTKRQMELSFSRGFSPGWLEGCNHKRLVPGLTSAKQGVLAGRVIRKKADRIVAELSVPLSKGDGVVFQADRSAGNEVGGRIFQIYVNHQSIDEAGPGRVELEFQKGLVRDAQIIEGQAIWQTDAPKLSKRWRQTFSKEYFERKVPLTVSGTIATGKPIDLQIAWQEHREGLRQSDWSIQISHEVLPQKALKHPATQGSIFQQLNRLGNTSYEIADCKIDILDEPMLPLSVLGELRRRIVEAVDAIRVRTSGRQVSPPGVSQKLLARVKASLVDPMSLEQSGQTINALPRLRVLCRTLVQLDALLEVGAKDVAVEFHDIREYRQAVDRAHRAGASIYLATLRILKEGESGLFKALHKHQADGWLARNLAALKYAREHGISADVDFSLNVTNPLTAKWLIDQGASHVTASYDLNRDQLMEFIQSTPPEWVEVVIHQHMPMFHMEHCVYCTVLSPGTNKSNCGRPCDRHEVKLRDRIGVEHVLHADIGCRNTLYNGNAQSGAEVVSKLLIEGITKFRIEILRDAPVGELHRLWELYSNLLQGKIDGSTVWKTLRAENRLGIIRGTLEHPRNPLAIL